MDIKERIIDELGFDPWVCCECGEVIHGPPLRYVPDYIFAADEPWHDHEAFCGAYCLLDMMCREGEAAEERANERYYGGDGPMSLREQQEAARRESR